MSIFKFVAPDWANSKTRTTTAEEALKRAKDLASSYYALGTQTHVHAMIEWCGVMGEYVKFLEYIHQTQGIDPREVDQHHDARGLDVPAYMVQYFCEKLGCQIKPLIRSNPKLWREHIDSWFKS